MSRPITPTPVLYGKDATDFLDRVERNRDKKACPVPTPKLNEALAEFAKKMKTEDIAPEFAASVDKHFWDLV